LSSQASLSHIGSDSMPRGTYPSEYFNTVNVRRSQERIYHDLDAWTYEIFPDEVDRCRSLGIIVVLPPLLYNGRFVKGMFYSPGIDYLRENFPASRELFLSIANSMCWSYPWSDSADAYLTCYHNPARQSWFERSNPYRADKACIPLQDADYTNEYLMAPVPVARKDIDVLCVSRLSAVKNLPIIARALWILRSKYPQQRIRMTLITGNRQRALSRPAVEQLKHIHSILSPVHDYIEFVEHVNHRTSMPQYYSRAKVCVLGSLLEGKNRSMNEAMSCDTPVICFKQFNQFTRGTARAFPAGAGLYCEFDPECLADTIYTVLNNGQAFAPRLAYLRTNGRRRFLSHLFKTVPYYRHVLPELTESRESAWLWLDLAIQHNYHVSLNNFIYGHTGANGPENIQRLMQFYRRTLDR
jgi:glycosyltransferase involved in cell wall biosynthesis